MRVLIITHEFPPVGGGVSDVAYNLASYLSEKDISISILTCKYLSFPITYLEKARIYTVPGFRSSYLHNLRTLTFISFIFFGFFKAIQIIKKDKITLIHCLMTIPAGFLGWLVSKITRIKYITSLHGSDVPHHSKNKIMLLIQPVVRKIWKDSNMITVVSKTLLNIGSETLNLTHKQIIIIPNGIESDFIEYKSQHQSIGNIFTFVSTSRLFEFKGIQDIIKSLAIVNQIQKGFSFQYKIIGDGPYLNALKEISLAYSLNNKIFFLGYLNKDKIIRELDNSHVFILTSYYESFGIVYLQAFARGLPIICSRNTGISEIINDTLGICVDAGNINQITNAITTIFSKYPMYNPETIKNKANEYTWDKISQKYINIYKLI